MKFDFHIAGGMFGVEEKYKKQLDVCFLRDGFCGFLNARSCMKFLADELNPRCVWLPSYICSSVVMSFVKNYPVRFYHIGEQLKVVDLDWVCEVNAGDLVVVVDYFGFYLNGSVVNAVKNKGAYILQDAAHSMLSSFARQQADFVVYSPRKIVGVPFGGILCSNRQFDFTGIKYEKISDIAYKSQVNAFIRRSLFDKDGATEWFSHYQQAEKLQPCGNFALDKLSFGFLENIDYMLISELRRRNYKILHEILNQIALFHDLPDNVVPLCFPTVMQNRDRIRLELYKEGVFCPVHWPVPGELPDGFDASRNLSNSILSVVCDHRLREEEVRKIGEFILRLV